MSFEYDCWYHCWPYQQCVRIDNTSNNSNPNNIGPNNSHYCATKNTNNNSNSTNKKSNNDNRNDDSDNSDDINDISGNKNDSRINIQSKE